MALPTTDAFTGLTGADVKKWHQDWQRKVGTADATATDDFELQWIQWAEREEVNDLMCANARNMRRPSTPARPSELQERELKFDRNTVVPLVYGRKKVEGIPIPVAVVGDTIHVCYVFCEGEIEAFEKFFINDDEVTEFTGLYGLTSYTGTNSQGYDTGFHTADTNWTEKLTATAYVAAWFKSDEKFSGLPKLSAVVKGLKVYDPRTAATAYSTNPILCTVDHLQSKRYGASVADAALDWDSVKAAANDCDETVGDETRYSLNYQIDSPSDIEQIQSYFLGHCNGDRLYSEGVYSFNIHKSRSAVTSFNQDTVWEVKLYRPKTDDLFNQARATYTLADTWQEDEYTLESPELIAGTEPLSEVSFDFTGCASLSQVHRLATFQLNSRRSDLKVEFNTHNTKGIQRYDRFTFSHSDFSLTDQDFYVTSVVGDRVFAAEYTEDLFSDDVLTNPSLPEVELIKPTATPDAITGLTLAEEVNQAKDAHFRSTIFASWTASVFPWVKYYEVWLKVEGDDYRLYDLTTDTSCPLTAVQELSTYTVKIVTVSEFDIKSTAVTESIYIEGKNWPPVWSTGATLNGAEAGDVAILDWDKAEDDDTVRYEIRRGRTTDGWEQASWVATIDALNYFDRSAPAGTWNYFVKAIDSVGQYTNTALSVEVEVTINPNLAFNRNQAIDLTGATVNQVAISPSSTDSDQAFPLTAAKDVWSERFSAGTAWDSTTDAPWPLAPTSGTIDLTTAVVDMGAQFTGEFTLSYSAAEYGTGSASLTPYLLYSLDGTSYTTVAASSAITITARYIKAKFVWTCPTSAANFYMVTEPVTVNVKAMPVIEFGTGTVPSGGSLSISFDMTFAAVDKVQLTPQGSSARIALADNITTSGFDIKLFDTSGAAAAGDVGWKVEGV